MKIYLLMLTKLKESITSNIWVQLKPPRRLHNRYKQQNRHGKQKYDRAEHNLERQVDNAATQNQTTCSKMSYMDGYDLWY